MIRGDPRPQGLVVHRCALTRRDLTTQRGVRATTPARTLLDCAPVLSARALTRAVNDARHAHVLSLDELRATLDRFPNHPGARRLRPHAETGDGASRSGWEDDFPAFCARHGLPRPRMNVEVCGFPVDALFAAERVIVELDSWEFHRDRAAFERDRDRDAVTTAAGYVTVRLTWQRIEGGAPVVAARLRATLARRADAG